MNIEKIILSFLVLLIITGCGSKDKPIEQPDGSHVVENDKVEDISISFSSEDFKKIFANQKETSEKWVSEYGNAFVDENTMVVYESGEIYEIKHDSIHTINDLRKYLLNYYTEDYVDRFIKEQDTFVEQDGKLYSKYPGCFGIGPGYETITINKTSEKSYSISFKYDWYIDNDGSDTRTINYVNERGIWVFDSPIGNFGTLDGFKCWSEDENSIVFVYGKAIGTLTLKNDVTLNIRDNPSTSGVKIGTVSSKIALYYYDVKENEGYTWYLISPDDATWIADNGEWIVLE